MIAFLSHNVLDAFSCGPDDIRGSGKPNYILSVKCSKGYCVSKMLVMSLGAPRLLTVVMLFDGQADIVAVPEFFASVYVPWHTAGEARAEETGRAFSKAGLPEPAACCVAIAVDIIYDVIDRDYLDCYEKARDCILTSTGLMELNDDCKERVFFEDLVLSDLPLADDEEPF
jgi:hypothetical protein